MHRSFSQILKLCCVLLLSSTSTAAISMNTGEFQAYLAAQNSVWAQHGVWADGCVFQHSAGTLGPFLRYGSCNPLVVSGFIFPPENLAAGTGDFTIQDAINAWTSEASQYDPNNPQPSHYTQVVWKGTKQVGCAEATCFPASFGPAQYYVCGYFPAGNVIGQFGANVQV
ncbi:PR-1-like protein, partial [Mycena leptocephala]